MAKTTTVTVDRLKRLSDAALAAAGVPAADAQCVTRVLVEADMMGVSTHGVVRLAAYTGRIRAGGVKARPNITIDRRAPSLALVDGDGGLGPVVGTRALETALAMAAETGIAYVGCRNSNHFGAMAPYALSACDAGMVMVSATNAGPTIPPWGGAEARLGNNPLCVAAPVPAGPHFILDMAMSVAARGKIRLAARDGRPIPEGWAVDAAGRPTTDPVKALKGFLIAFGDHKGPGLSMAVDILAGVLTGANFLTGVASWVDHPDTPQGAGHFFLLIDPGRLVGADAFADAITRFCGSIRSTRPADPAQPVILPGEREQARRRAAIVDGVAVADDLLAEVEALARA
ncbi:MAG TPA: Ldh family oxidoreductase [Rhodospirillales bacterium]